jgi:hypothetical protein
MCDEERDCFRHHRLFLPKLVGVQLQDYPELVLMPSAEEGGSRVHFEGEVVGNMHCLGVWV